MLQKTYLTILKFGVYLAFLSPFLVYNRFLFPYITSKQIYFNILIEILFVFWLAFIIKYPEFRPKKFLITGGLVAYFAAILLSSIFSVDFNLSFWGDVERMLGFFHIFHFFIYYLIVITVIREKKDWNALMIVSVAAAIIISIHALAGKSYATIGNAAYVGGYLIFNIYFALILFFGEKKENYARWLYLIAVIIMLPALKNTGVAGSYVGLGISLILALFLFGILHKNKKIKIYTLSVSLLAIVLIVSIFLNRSNPSVRKIEFLNNILSEVSLGKNTFQTRLISWKTAWKDFPSHPILGAGYGNFAITFDKYFDPKFYNYTRSETYFDRAHNNLVDIASTTGILGLVTYLFIFSAVIYYLIVGYREEKISLIEFVLLFSLIAAYFVQNLAVFDSLVTYIPLMMTFGFIYWLYNKDGENIISRWFEKILGWFSSSDKKNQSSEISILAITGIVIFFVMYQYNIKPIKMLMGTIKGQEAFAQNDVRTGFTHYKKALSYNTILDRDSRDSLIRLMSNLVPLNKVSKDEGAQILEYVIDASQKNLNYNFRDSLALIEHSQLLNVAAEYFRDDKEKFSYYSKLAEEAADKSIESAPGRIPHYFQKAQVYITRGDMDKAVETLKYAYGLNNDYYESVCKLAKVEIVLKKDEGYSNMNQCLDKGGAETLYPSSFVGQLINYYAGKNDSARVLKLYEKMARLESNNAKILANLAQLYAREGQKEKAIEMARKAAELDPAIKDAAEEFIRKLGE